MQTKPSVNQKIARLELINNLNNQNFKDAVHQTFYKFINKHADFNTALHLFGLQNLTTHLNHLIDFNYPNYQIINQINTYENFLTNDCFYIK